MAARSSKAKPDGILDFLMTPAGSVPAGPEAEPADHRTEVTR